LTGTPTAPTAALATNTTQIATTQFVRSEIANMSLGSGTITGTLSVVNGGTGQSSFTDGQLLIGNSDGNTLSKSTLTAGNGVVITNGNGSIRIDVAGGTGGVGTVTNVNPITVNASGSTFTSTVTNASTTPAISLTIPLASVAGTTAGLLSNTDYEIFNAKQGALTAGSGISIASNTISATGLTTSNLSSSAGILNAQLANSEITLGSTAMSLGGTYTSLTGLSSVTSINFTGTLSGTASGLTTGRTISTTGDVAYTSAIFNGTADVTGAATVNSVGGVSSSTITTVASAVNSATSSNLANTIVKRDGAGDFVVGAITATALSSGTLSLTTPLSVLSGGTGTNSSTGTGMLVLSSSPALTGTPTAITAAPGTNSTQIATTAFVSALVGGSGAPDATSTVKGILQLTNDLGGSAELPIVNSVGGVSSSTITTVASSVNSATSSNTANTIVKRDVSGAFAAGAITANSVLTNALNVTSGTYTRSGSVLTSDALGNATWGTSGLYRLNGIIATNQTFAATITSTFVTPSYTSAGSVHTLNLPLASYSSTTAGLLSKADYDVFNAKQGALTAGADYIVPNSAITGATKTKITYDTKGLVTAGADATTADIAPSADRNYVTDIKAGVLSNTSGVNTGDQTITLTGDVTGTGTGTFTSTIANSAVTYAKMQNLTAGKLLGSISGSDAAPGAVAIGSGLSLSGGTLTASGTGGTVTNVNPITVTASGSTFTSTVTNASTTPAITLTIPLASQTGTTAGLLSKADYDVFNAKQSALTAGTGSGISISGGTISATGITSANLSPTAGITNGQLANSAITLGSTSMSLGSTNTTIAGLTSVTSTGFTGALTGNASTATALATARSIYGNDFNGTAALSGVISTTFGGTGASSTSQNFVFAGPTSGAGAPGFRLLTSADVPAGSGNYIANGTTQQASSNFNISGSGVVGTSLSAGSLSLTTALTATNGGTGQSTYTTGDILYASAANTLSKLGIGATGTVLTVNSGIPSWGSNGLYSLNGITSGTQSLTTGTSGTDFNISSSGSTHTFNLPDASAMARGAVTIGAQTFAGDKTFSGTLSTTSLTAISGLTAGAVTYPIAHGSSGQVLSTTGSGTLTWTTPSSGGVTTISGGTTGLTPNTATSGVVTLAGTLVAANGGTGQSTYATGDILYASATNTLSKLTIGSAGQVLTVSSGIPSWGSNGLYSLNGITSGTHSLTTGLTGTDFNISSSGSTHTFNIPDAGATSTTRGLVSINAQTFYGAKTFNSDLIANGYTIGKGNGNVSSNLAIGSGNFHTTNSTGTANLAIGTNALFNNRTGQFSTSVGHYTLNSSSTGTSNNAFGYYALFGGYGSYNTAIGDSALSSYGTSILNTAVGNSSMKSNTSGSFNTAVGNNSLITNTTGTYNTAIGINANVFANNLTNATAIGANATVSASNTIQLGNTSVTDVKTSGKVTASSFVVSGGTATQALMANGTYGTLPAAHYVGESYGGGIVFYVYDNGQHGLIAATTNQSNGVIWGVSSTIRTFGDGIGAGRNNTAVIASYSNSNSDNAASVCMNYSVTVDNVRYADWYLPSYHELTLLFNQKSLSGLNMSIGEWWYWSSTEMSNIGAWTVKFKDGYTNNQTQKNNSGVLVRAIRHF
jgi:hypothetical protein